MSRLSPRPSLPADANASSLHPGRGPGANVLTLGMSSAQSDKQLLVVTLGLSLVTLWALPIYADVRQKAIKSSIIILRCRQCYVCLFSHARTTADLAIRLWDAFAPGCLPSYCCLSFAAQQIDHRTTLIAFIDLYFSLSPGF